jgi:hypothetical protein
VGGAAPAADGSARHGVPGRARLHFGVDRTVRPIAATARRRAATLLLLVVALVASAACRPPAERADPNRPVDVALRTAPARVGPAVVEVRLTIDGATVTGAAVEIVGDMTHAGMVPEVATAVDVGGGVYRSEGFTFTMAGDWVITAEVRYPDGVRGQGSTVVSVQR